MVLVHKSQKLVVPWHWHSPLPEPKYAELVSDKKDSEILVRDVVLNGGVPFYLKPTLVQISHSMHGRPKVPKSMSEDRNVGTSTITLGL